MIWIYDMPYEVSCGAGDRRNKNEKFFRSFKTSHRRHCWWLSGSILSVRACVYVYVFMCVCVHVEDLRLQLLDVEHNHHLVKSLYGLLMLLPQTDAFRTLQRRLHCIPSAAHMTSSTSTTKDQRSVLVSSCV